MWGGGDKKWCNIEGKNSTELKAMAGLRDETAAVVRMSRLRRYRHVMRRRKFEKSAKVGAVLGNR